jgi:hypothetical protein
VPRLDGLREGRDHQPFSVKVDQHWLGRYVVIPEVLMHDLKTPHRLARRGTERDDRVGVVVPPGLLAPEPRSTVPPPPMCTILESPQRGQRAADFMRATVVVSCSERAFR